MTNMTTKIETPANHGCKTHNGEHPFYWKESVGAYVTYCHEVFPMGETIETYPKRR